MFFLPAVCECAVYLLSAFAPSPPSLSLVKVRVWGGKYVHWLTVSVMVPGGWHCQDCHTYLHALFHANVSAVSSPGHLFLAHKLEMSSLGL